MFCSSCGTEMVEAASFCRKCGAKADAQGSATSTDGFAAAATRAFPASVENNKLLAILANLGGVFFGFIPALVVFLIKKDEPSWVLDSAREALNWQITVMIAAMVCVVLMFVLIGIVLFWILMVANLVFSILATVKASEQQAYRYPLSLRLIK